MPDDQAGARLSYDEVAEELKLEGATSGAMFGMPTLKTGGKAFAGYTSGAMVFKLRGDDHSAALALPGAHLFEPMSGRPMREWVQVPSTAAVRWPELARAALRTVRGSAQPDKEPRR